MSVSRPPSAATGKSLTRKSSTTCSIPHSIRLPPRYAAEAERAAVRMECRAVDPEAIRRAFQVWDSDDDGRIDEGDLKSFVRKMALQAPVGGWDAYIEAMVKEAISRTGFAAPVGMVRCATPVMTVPDVQAASSFRVQTATRRRVVRRRRRPRRRTRGAGTSRGRTGTRGSR